MGQYIVFEGLDASGKTTHSEGLVERLKSAGHKAVWTREPGSPLIDLKVRDFILSDKKISPRALELLLQADRAEHISKIKPLLDEGYWVISDRSYVSGLAYALAKDMDPVELHPVINFAVDGIHPHIVFIMDVPLEEAKKRRADRGIADTREEKRGDEFAQRVKNNFLIIAATQNTIQDFQIINGMLPKADIAAFIDSKLNLT